MKPILASPVNLGAVKFPVYVSPKLDGIRCLCINGVALSRKLLPIPNKKVQEYFHKHRAVLEGMDGELCVGHPTEPGCFNTTQSGVMTIEGEPYFTYHVFDSLLLGPDAHWLARYGKVKDIEEFLPTRVFLVRHDPVYSLDEFMKAAGRYIKQGYEGIMGRDPAGRYKFGRSTPREQILWKYKLFEDFEAEIIGVEEQYTNTNEQKRDELGNAKRSSAKDGMIPAGTLGALICRSPEYAQAFRCGSGFSGEEAARLWKMHQAGTLVGKLATIKHQPSGAKDAPRFPVYKGLRDRRDV